MFHIDCNTRAFLQKRIRKADVRVVLVDPVKGDVATACNSEQKPLLIAFDVEAEGRSLCAQALAQLSLGDDAKNHLYFHPPNHLVLALDASTAGFTRCATQAPAVVRAYFKAMKHSKAIGGGLLVLTALGAGALWWSANSEKAVEGKQSTAKDRNATTTKAEPTAAPTAESQVKKSTTAEKAVSPVKKPAADKAETQVKKPTAAAEKAETQVKKPTAAAEKAEPQVKKPTAAALASEADRYSQEVYAKTLEKLKEIPTAQNLQTTRSILEVAQFELDAVSKKWRSTATVVGQKCLQGAAEAIDRQQVIFQEQYVDTVKTMVNEQERILQEAQSAFENRPRWTRKHKRKSRDAGKISEIEKKRLERLVDQARNDIETIFAQIDQIDHQTLGLESEDRVRATSYKQKISELHGAVSDLEVFKPSKEIILDAGSSKVPWHPGRGRQWVVLTNLKDMTIHRGTEPEMVHVGTQYAVAENDKTKIRFQAKPDWPAAHPPMFHFHSMGKTVSAAGWFNEDRTLHVQVPELPIGTDYHKQMRKVTVVPDTQRWKWRADENDVQGGMDEQLDITSIVHNREPTSPLPKLIVLCEVHAEDAKMWFYEFPIEFHKFDAAAPPALATPPAQSLFVKAWNWLLGE